MQEMQETQVHSLGQEDSLEKEMATHSSILAWRILWSEEPLGLQSTRLQRVGHDRAIEHIVNVGNIMVHKRLVHSQSVPRAVTITTAHQIHPALCLWNSRAS